MSLPQTIQGRKPPSNPSPVQIFELRAWAVATLVNNSMLADKQTAVDGLWRFAESLGLVATLGADAVQKIMADAFRQELC